LQQKSTHMTFPIL